MTAHLTSDHSTPWLSFGDTRINRDLDLVTAIFTRPEMTDFVFAHERRPLRPDVTGGSGTFQSLCLDGSRVPRPFHATRRPVGCVRPDGSAARGACIAPTRSSSPAAQRMRRHRKQRRQGLRSVRILLDETDIDALIRLRLLKEDQRQDVEALQAAVLGLVYRAEEDLA